MKVSIITVSHNSAKTIEDTILSVINQNGNFQIEYIIIDGGSIDGTLEIINKYRDRISKIISEPDKGIYDAMNKGVRFATGDIVGILNSDDYYVNNTVVESVVNEFVAKDIDACYGDLVYVSRQDKNKIVRKWTAGEYNRKKLFYGWIPPHPTFFVKKEIIDKFGLFDLNFKIASDYEFMLRLISKGKIKMNYLPKALVCMRAGGYSARSVSQRIRGWRELYQAWRINNLKPPKLLFIKRPLFKIKQYLF